MTERRDFLRDQAICSRIKVNRLRALLEVAEARLDYYERQLQVTDRRVRPTRIIYRGEKVYEGA